MTTPPPSTDAQFLDYYDVLGIDPIYTNDSNESNDFVTKTVRKAFLKLSKQLHPDKNIHASTDEEGKKKINTNFCTLKEAYDVLSCPQQKRVYDIERTTYLRRKFEEAKQRSDDRASQREQRRRRQQQDPQKENDKQKQQDQNQNHQNRQPQDQQQRQQQKQQKEKQQQQHRHKHKNDGQETTTNDRASHAPSGGSSTHHPDGRRQHQYRTFNKGQRQQRQNPSTENPYDSFRYSPHIDTSHGKT